MSKNKGRKKVGKMMCRSVMSCIVLEKLDRYDMIGGNTVRTFSSYQKVASPFVDTNAVDCSPEFRIHRYRTIGCDDR